MEDTRQRTSQVRFSLTEDTPRALQRADKKSHPIFCQMDVLNDENSAWHEKSR